MKDRTLFPPATRNLLIFRSELLLYSETFIRSQAEQYKTFTPYYTGFLDCRALELPHERTLISGSSRALATARIYAAIFGVVEPWFLSAARKIRPELIHAHFEESGINALPLASRLKVPLFVTSHGYDVTSKSSNRWQKRPWLGEFYQRRREELFKKASLCFGVSRFICDQMLLKGYPAKKVRLHYIGVDVARFCPDPSVTQRPQIIFVGRLVEKKGCADLLKAMIEVGTKHPDIELVIVGDGPLRESLEKFAIENKINARFLGVQAVDAVLRLLRESLLLCLPSVRGKTGDSEGLGIVNLEAQAVGLPVVGTLHGGIPEAVEDGVTGLLSEERDPSALARNIITLLSDTPLRLKMGEAARARVIRQFDLNKQSQLLEETYLSVL